MIKTVKYFKESSFGPITLYTGRMGSGLTLGAIIRIVRASRAKIPPKIVTNCILKGLDYEHISKESFLNKVEDYLKGSYLFLFDSGYSYFASRANVSKVLVQFFNLLRKCNSKAILTTSSGLEVIDKNIRPLISDMVLVSSKLPRSQKLSLTHYRLSTRTIWCESEDTGRKERCTEFYWKLVSKCIMNRVGKYWKYYSTTEIPW